MKKIAFYDTKDFSQSSFEKYRPNDLSITYFEHKLTPDTDASAAGFDAVCIFVHDIVDATVA
ncbi:MAG: 2-hydroxyacid dehydrogenase, partial [Candidatus Hydrogenedentes bacterium]|nr:2-hydroxyacid dehydrogenase [Candidatus Hydrogenedentota bacterium]